MKDNWVDSIKAMHTPCKLIITKVEQLNKDGSTTLLYKKGGDKE